MLSSSTGTTAVWCNARVIHMLRPLGVTSVASRIKPLLQAVRVVRLGQDVAVCSTLLLKAAHRQQSPFFFFFNNPAPPEIYPLPLPDPLPIFRGDLVDAARRRATAGEDDAALSDVGAKLGGSLFERLLHGAHDTLQRLLQRLEDLVAVECEAARHALGQVATLDGQLAHLLARVGGADLDLDALGGRLADENAVIAAHVVHDGFIETVAADARRVGVDDSIQ